MKLTALFVCSILCFTNTVFAQCTGIRQVAPNEINSIKPVGLFSKMIAACKSDVPDNFFALQTSITRKALSGLPNKREIFNLYCKGTQEALNKLGGRAENAVHSIKIDSYKTECGEKVSTWYTNTKSGETVMRIDVAIEGGQLMINTQ